MAGCCTDAPQPGLDGYRRGSLIREAGLCIAPSLPCSSYSDVTCGSLAPGAWRDCSGLSRTRYARRGSGIAGVHTRSYAVRVCVWFGSTFVKELRISTVVSRYSTSCFHTHLVSQSTCRCTTVACQSQCRPAPPPPCQAPLSVTAANVFPRACTPSAPPSRRWVNRCRSRSKMDRHRTMRPHAVIG